MGSEREEPSQSGTRQTRQRKREQVKDDPPPSQKVEPAEDDDDAENDEDVTRCVCGSLEYPGPPKPAGDFIKALGKEENLTGGSDEISDDAGGLFISCDICQVWQHGGCVGIMDESMCPENYYCEQCRPSYHKLQKDSKGYVYFLLKVDSDVADCSRPP